MKLLFIMFIFLFMNTPQSVCKEEKKTIAQKKEAKGSFDLAPSILIINY